MLSINRIKSKIGHIIIIDFSATLLIKGEWFPRDGEGSSSVGITAAAYIHYEWTFAHLHITHLHNTLSIHTRAHTSRSIHRYSAKGRLKK